MRKMRILVERNLTLFLKNSTNVILCCFSIVIVLGLYVLFLRDFIMQLSVGDMAKGVQKDYLVAPLTKFELVIGYWITSVIVSFFFTCLTFLGVEAYFIWQYEASISSGELLKSIGTIGFSSCMNSGLLLCMIRFMKDTTSFSTFGNLYGMMCGFLAGTYLPYAMYPQRMRTILFYFPPMQLTSVIRQVCLAGYKEGGNVIGQQLYEAYGVTLLKEGVAIPMRQKWSYLVFSLAVVVVLVRMEYGEVKRRM